MCLPAFRIKPDLAGRTFQILNDKDELVCMVQKSMKALIKNAALGAGSEMLIDVATGVDWTAMVAVVLAIQQVGFRGFRLLGFRVGQIRGLGWVVYGL